MMAVGMTATTASPTIAFLTAAAITAAAGLAYWSSVSNTTDFGILVIEILRFKGTRKQNQNDKMVGLHKTSNDEKKKSNGNNREDNFEEAFVSWLDREENEGDSSYINVTDENGSLTDPQWMSRTIWDALHLTAMPKADFKSANDRSFLEENLCMSSKSSSVRDKCKQQTIFKNDEEIACNKACDVNFSRSFRALKNATKVMMEKEPAIREDFFNGVILDGEHDQWEEETKHQRRRSLSLCSSSSWSVMSSSVSSYEINEDDCLVEEEDEVERLLSYLHFVELAKESLLTTSNVMHDHVNGYLPKIRERIVPDTGGYEILSSVTMESRAEPDIQKAKVSHTAALHRDRKELLIAIHYDGRTFPNSITGDRNKIQTILRSALLLQQQGQSPVTQASPSDSFFLLDEIVKSLYEEILLRYVNTNIDDKSRTRFSFLSSGYSLVLCGHSIGAALACKLGEMLTNQNVDNISESFEVRVYAFGPPPCLPSRQTSRQNLCLDGDFPVVEYPFITSVVNNHDCIPRWTESNLVGLRIRLNSLMDRKRRHFQRYHNRYNRRTASTNPATTGKTTALRRSTLRVPPFTASSRDWRMFWKSDQEPNDFFSQGIIGDIHPRYIVPGKVVSIWNHSQDPTIIGAKVHSRGRKHVNPSSYDSHHFLRHQRAGRKNHDVLGRLWIDEGMFSDHTIEAYRSNLELLLEQVGNTI